MKLLYTQLLSLRWWRRYCWTVAGVAVGVASLRALVALPLQVEARDMTLPQTLEIPSWQQVYGRRLDLTSADQGDYNQPVDQRQYELVRQDQRITIIVVTLEHTTGEVAYGLRQYGALPEAAIANLEPIDSAHGRYGLIQDSDRYYLSSCLHQDGHGTLTAAEYGRYAGSQLVQPRILGRWLLGQHPIPDHRCWWILMKTKEHPDAIMPAPQLLRQAWDTLPPLQDQ